MQPAAQANPDMQRQKAFDRTFGVLAFGLLAAAVLASTWLHHFRPEVLRVPDNADIGSWRNPAFENTTLFGRASGEEKARLLREGVPQGNDLPAQFLVGDLFCLLLGAGCFLHARKHFGFWMASCFLVGSFVFTGLEESMWILVGRFLTGEAVNPLGQTIHGTYWFTKGGLWFLETPVTACIGWFFIAYACVLTAGKVFPGMNRWARAGVGGLIAMGIDLWMDPVATSPAIMNWVWANGDVLLLFGIPHTNFMGWFLLIFLFAVFWEQLPAMESRWGRPRGTARFFLIILTTEIGILVFFAVWIAGLGGLLARLGVREVLQIPPGW